MGADKVLDTVITNALIVDHTGKALTGYAHIAPLSLHWRSSDHM